MHHFRWKAQREDKAAAMETAGIPMAGTRTCLGVTHVELLGVRVKSWSLSNVG